MTLYTAAEAADRYGVTPRFIRSIIQRRCIAHARMIGKTRMYNDDQVAAMEPDPPGNPALRQRARSAGRPKRTVRSAR